MLSPMYSMYNAPQSVTQMGSVAQSLDYGEYHSTRPMLPMYSGVHYGADGKILKAVGGWFKKQGQKYKEDEEFRSTINEGAQTGVSLFRKDDKPTSSSSSSSRPLTPLEKQQELLREQIAMAQGKKPAPPLLQPIAQTPIVMPQIKLPQKEEDGLPMWAKVAGGIAVAGVVVVVARRLL